MNKEFQFYLLTLGEKKEFTCAEFMEMDKEVITIESDLWENAELEIAKIYGSDETKAWSRKYE